MIIIGVDFHPAYQEIASVNTDTGEYQEKRLAHPEEAEEFYRSLVSVGQTVRVGMEASGQAQWFERLLEGLGVELWRGDAEVIRAKRGRKQKTDREDARHILKLLWKDDFPRGNGVLLYYKLTKYGALDPNYKLSGEGLIEVVRSQGGWAVANYSSYF